MDTWTGRDGTVTPVRELQYSHLINIIKMLERTLDARPVYIPYMGDSEYAEDAVESEEMHNEALAQDIVEKLNVLRAEKRRRDEQEGQARPSNNL